ncbi:pyridoxal phosphate-dependent transferase [Mycena filopes]|nr:pyridoxal phosphate-dependent transferase [Mycena filopes]
MPVTPIATELGHSMPPEGPHTITVHAKGWDTALAFRNGDQTLFAKIRSLYPRFMPFGPVKELSMAIHTKLSLPPMHGCLPFISPDAFAIAQEYAFSHHRKPVEARLTAADLTFKVVDIGGTRLYCVVYPMPKTPGILGAWQNPGMGVSSRLAEALLKKVDTLTEVHFDTAGDGDVSVEKIPAPTYVPESEAHQGLRERIVGLLKRAPVKTQEKEVAVDDIYLYPTGMAAIYRLHQAIMQTRKGPIVSLGAVFHNTWHLFAEAPDGFKHFGQCDAKSGVMDKLEEYLKGEAKEGRQIGYVFVEFPSNPLLVSVDLYRLRQLADKYGFSVVVDDTIGSFSSVDLLPVADIILSSLTKSFSGYADVMCGSVILNPSLPSYAALKKVYGTLFRNEFFAGDAQHLLSNSADYLERSTILNRNALAVATLLHGRASQPDSAVTGSLYPPFLDTIDNYTALMRPATPEFTPGYGCLLSVDFASLTAARAFYDNLHVHQGPHLGAHLTLAVPFNELVWGKDAKEFEYHVAYGLRGEQVRIAVGLEPEADLLAVVEEALRHAEEAWQKEKTDSNSKP